jgi:hypothetical protein
LQQWIGFSTGSFIERHIFSLIGLHAIQNGVGTHRHCFGSVLKPGRMDGTSRVDGACSARWRLKGVSYYFLFLVTWNRFHVGQLKLRRTPESAAWMTAPASNVK